MEKHRIGADRAAEERRRMDFNWFRAQGLLGKSRRGWNVALASVVDGHQSDGLRGARFGGLFVVITCPSSI